MRFSIIIPTRKINHYLIDDCLPAIDRLTFETPQAGALGIFNRASSELKSAEAENRPLRPGLYHGSMPRRRNKNFEAIVLPNKRSSNDSKLTKKYSWLRIISSGKISRPAQKRNFGAKQARGEILAFLDDDAFPDKNWLIAASSLLQQPLELREFQIASRQSKSVTKTIQAVCGPGILPSKTNFWEKIFDEVLKSWIGSGGYSYRFIPQKTRFVDDYPSMNFLVRKDVFCKLGGFNNNYWPGEDSKLCEDIVYKEKGTILYDPKVLVYHHRRNNLLDFLKQHANYGFHRGAFFAHGDRNSRRLSYLIPTFFIFYLSFIVTYSLFFFIFQQYDNIAIEQLNNILLMPLWLYLLLIIYLAIIAFINTKNLLISFLSPLVLFFTHLTYGIMFIRGFFIGLIKKNNIYND